MEANESTTTDAKDVRSGGRSASGALNPIAAARDSAQHTVDRMASGAHAAVDTVAGAATHAAETLDVKGEQLKGAQKKLVESAQEYMRDHPAASLGIAMAAGYVLSRLLSR